MALLKRKRVGLNDAMSVVTRFVNACNRHDADGVASCLHPDFDSIQPMYPARNFRGADQVRRNWQAIFDAEPGFRLTVLRSAAMDDTVWLELHGAGREAEVAGVFVMGIQGDRIRWARIYSALVEPVPAGMGEPVGSTPLHEVPRTDQAPAAENGEVIEEDLIAPVLDIGRSGRRRRRRRGEDEAAPIVAEAEPEGDDDAAVDAEPGTEVGVDGETAEDPPASVEAVAEPEPEVGVDAAAVEGAVDADAEAVVVIDGVAETDVVVAVDGDAGPEIVVVEEIEPDVEPAADAPVSTADEDGGPPTEAVEMAVLTEPDPEPEPEPEPEPDPPIVAETPKSDPPRRLFGKRQKS